MGEKRDGTGGDSCSDIGSDFELDDEIRQTLNSLLSIPLEFETSDEEEDEEDDTSKNNANNRTVDGDSVERQLAAMFVDEKEDGGGVSKDTDTGLENISDNELDGPESGECDTSDGELPDSPAGTTRPVHGAESRGESDIEIVENYPPAREHCDNLSRRDLVKNPDKEIIKPETAKTKEKKIKSPSKSKEKSTDKKRKEKSKKRLEEEELKKKRKLSKYLARLTQYKDKCLAYMNSIASKCSVDKTAEYDKTEAERKKIKQLKRKSLDVESSPRSSVSSKIDLISHSSHSSRSDKKSRSSSRDKERKSNSPKKPKSKAKQIQMQYDNYIKYLQAEKERCYAFKHKHKPKKKRRKSESSSPEKTIGSELLNPRVEPKLLTFEQFCMSRELTSPPKEEVSSTAQVQEIDDSEKTVAKPKEKRTISVDSIATTVTIGSEPETAVAQEDDDKLFVTFSDLVAQGKIDKNSKPLEVLKPEIVEEKKLEANTNKETIEQTVEEDPALKSVSVFTSVLFKPESVGIPFLQESPPPSPKIQPLQRSLLLPAHSSEPDDIYDNEDLSSISQSSLSPSRSPAPKIHNKALLNFVENQKDKIKRRQLKKKNSKKSTSRSRSKSPQRSRKKKRSQSRSKRKSRSKHRSASSLSPSPPLVIRSRSSSGHKKRISPPAYLKERWKDYPSPPDRRKEHHHHHHHHHHERRSSKRLRRSRSRSRVRSRASHRSRSSSEERYRSRYRSRSHSRSRSRTRSPPPPVGAMVHTEKRRKLKEEHEKALESLRASLRKPALPMTTTPLSIEFTTDDSDTFKPTIDNYDQVVMNEDSSSNSLPGVPGESLTELPPLPPGLPPEPPPAPKKAALNKQEDINPYPSFPPVPPPPLGFVNQMPPFNNWMQQQIYPPHQMMSSFSVPPPQQYPYLNQPPPPIPYHMQMPPPCHQHYRMPNPGPPPFTIHHDKKSSNPSPAVITQIHDSSDDDVQIMSNTDAVIPTDQNKCQHNPLKQNHQTVQEAIDSVKECLKKYDGLKSKDPRLTAVQTITTKSTTKNCSSTNDDLQCDEKKVKITLNYKPRPISDAKQVCLFDAETEGESGEKSTGVGDARIKTNNYSEKNCKIEGIVSKLKDTISTGGSNIKKAEENTAYHSNGSEKNHDSKKQNSDFCSPFTVTVENVCDIHHEVLCSSESRNLDKKANPSPTETQHKLSEEEIERINHQIEEAFAFVFVHSVERNRLTPTLDTIKAQKVEEQRRNTLANPLSKGLQFSTSNECAKQESKVTVTDTILKESDPKTQVSLYTPRPPPIKTDTNFDHVFKSSRPLETKKHNLQNSDSEFCSRTTQVIASTLPECSHKEQTINKEKLTNLVSDQFKEKLPSGTELPTKIRRDSLVIEPHISKEKYVGKQFTNSTDLLTNTASSNEADNNTKEEHFEKNLLGNCNTLSDCDLETEKQNKLMEFQPKDRYKDSQLKFVNNKKEELTERSNENTCETKNNDNANKRSVVNAVTLPNSYTEELGEYSSYLENSDRSVFKIVNFEESNLTCNKNHSESNLNTPGKNENIIPEVKMNASIERRGKPCLSIPTKGELKRFPTPERSIPKTTMSKDERKLEDRSKYQTKDCRIRREFKCSTDKDGIKQKVDKSNNNSKEGVEHTPHHFEDTSNLETSSILEDRDFKENTDKCRKTENIIHTAKMEPQNSVDNELTPPSEPGRMKSSNYEGCLSHEERSNIKPELHSENLETASDDNIANQDDQKEKRKKRKRKCSRESKRDVKLLKEMEVDMSNDSKSEKSNQTPTEIFENTQKETFPLLPIPDNPILSTHVDLKPCPLSKKSYSYISKHLPPSFDLSMNDHLIKKGFKKLKVVVTKLHGESLPVQPECKSTSSVGDNLVEGSENCSVLEYRTDVTLSNQIESSFFNNEEEKVGNKGKEKSKKKVSFDMNVSEIIVESEKFLSDDDSQQNCCENHMSPGAGASCSSTESILETKSNLAKSSESESNTCYSTSKEEVCEIDHAIKSDDITHSSVIEKEHTKSYESSIYDFYKGIMKTLDEFKTMPPPQMQARKSLTISVPSPEDMVEVRIKDFEKGESSFKKKKMTCKPKQFNAESTAFHPPDEVSSEADRDFSGEINSETLRKNIEKEQSSSLGFGEAVKNNNTRSVGHSESDNEDSFTLDRELSDLAKGCLDSDSSVEGDDDSVLDFGIRGSDDSSVDCDDFNSKLPFRQKNKPSSKNNKKRFPKKVKNHGVDRNIEQAHSPTDKNQSSNELLTSECSELPTGSDKSVKNVSLLQDNVSPLRKVRKIRGTEKKGEFSLSNHEMSSDSSKSTGLSGEESISSSIKRSENQEGSTTMEIKSNQISTSKNKKRHAKNEVPPNSYITTRTTRSGRVTVKDFPGSKEESVGECDSVTDCTVFSEETEFDNTRQFTEKSGEENISLVKESVTGLLSAKSTAISKLRKMRKGKKIVENEETNDMNNVKTNFTDEKFDENFKELGFEQNHSEIQTEPKEKSLICVENSLSQENVYDIKKSRRNKGKHGTKRSPKVTPPSLNDRLQDNGLRKTRTRSRSKVENFESLNTDKAIDNIPFKYETTKLEGKEENKCESNDVKLENYGTSTSKTALKDDKPDSKTSLEKLGKYISDEPLMVLQTKLSVAEKEENILKEELILKNVAESSIDTCSTIIESVNVEEKIKCCVTGNSMSSSQPGEQKNENGEKNIQRSSTSDEYNSTEQFQNKQTNKNSFTGNDHGDGSFNQERNSSESFFDSSLKSSITIQDKVLVDEEGNLLLENCNTLVSPKIREAQRKKRDKAEVDAEIKRRLAEIDELEKIAKNQHAVALEKIGARTRSKTLTKQPKSTDEDVVSISSEDSTSTSADTNYVGKIAASEEADKIEVVTTKGPQENQMLKEGQLGSKITSSKEAEVDDSLVNPTNSHRSVRYDSVSNETLKQKDNILTQKITFSNNNKECSKVVTPIYCQKYLHESLEQSSKNYDMVSSETMVQTKKPCQLDKRSTPQNTLIINKKELGSEKPVSINPKSVASIYNFSDDDDCDFENNTDNMKSSSNFKYTHTGTNKFFKVDHNNAANSNSSNLTEISLLSEEIVNETKPTQQSKISEVLAEKPFGSSKISSPPTEDIETHSNKSPNCLTEQKLKKQKPQKFLAEPDSSTPNDINTFSSVLSRANSKNSSKKLRFVKKKPTKKIKDQKVNEPKVSNTFSTNKLTRKTNINQRGKSKIPQLDSCDSDNHSPFDGEDINNESDSIGNTSEHLSVHSEDVVSSSVNTIPEASSQLKTKRKRKTCVDLLMEDSMLSVVRDFPMSPNPYILPSFYKEIEIANNKSLCNTLVAENAQSQSENRVLPPKPDVMAQKLKLIEKLKNISRKNRKTRQCRTFVCYNEDSLPESLVESPVSESGQSNGDNLLSNELISYKNKGSLKAENSSSESSDEETGDPTKNKNVKKNINSETKSKKRGRKATFRKAPPKTMNRRKPNPLNSCLKEENVTDNLKKNTERIGDDHSDILESSLITSKDHQNESVLNLNVKETSASDQLSEFDKLIENKSNADIEQKQSTNEYEPTPQSPEDRSNDTSNYFFGSLPSPLVSDSSSEKDDNSAVVDETGQECKVKSKEALKDFSKNTSSEEKIEIHPGKILCSILKAKIGKLLPYFGDSSTDGEDDHDEDVPLLFKLSQSYKTKSKVTSSKKLEQTLRNLRKNVRSKRAPKRKGRKPKLLNSKFSINKPEKKFTRSSVNKNQKERRVLISHKDILSKTEHHDTSGSSELLDANLQTMLRKNCQKSDDDKMDNESLKEPKICYGRSEQESLEKTVTIKKRGRPAKLKLGAKKLEDIQNHSLLDVKKAEEDPKCDSENDSELTLVKDSVTDNQESHVIKMDNVSRKTRAQKYLKNESDNEENSTKDHNYFNEVVEHDDINLERNFEAFKTQAAERRITRGRGVDTKCASDELSKKGLVVNEENELSKNNEISPDERDESPPPLMKPRARRPRNPASDNIYLDPPNLETPFTVETENEEKQSKESSLGLDVKLNKNYNVPNCVKKRGRKSRKMPVSKREIEDRLPEHEEVTVSNESELDKISNLEEYDQETVPDATEEIHVSQRRKGRKRKRKMIKKNLEITSDTQSMDTTFECNVIEDIQNSNEKSRDKMSFSTRSNSNSALPLNDTFDTSEADSFNEHDTVNLVVATKKNLMESNNDKTDEHTFSTSVKSKKANPKGELGSSTNVSAECDSSEDEGNVPLVKKKKMINNQNEEETVIQERKTPLSSSEGQSTSYNCLNQSFLWNKISAFLNKSTRAVGTQVKVKNATLKGFETSEPVVSLQSEMTLPQVIKNLFEELKVLDSSFSDS